MHPKTERALQRWLEAGLLDAATAGRIRAFEARQEESHGLHWPVLLALALGGLLLGAGVLLFVAAHWDDLSPGQRFSLVLLMTAVFHAGGALAAERFPALATTFHAVGTVTLGAGIFLAGQIFNLAEHWPGGIMLWAAGAWLAWALLGGWPQAALAAILTPAWLASEWMVATKRMTGSEIIEVQGLLVLAFTYLSARLPERESAVRKALVVIGALAVIPLSVLAAERWWGIPDEPIQATWQALGWGIGLGAPLALAYVLRGRAGWMNLVSAFWVAVLATITTNPHLQVVGAFEYFWRDLGRYLWLAVGALGMIAWGMKEQRRERINLGIAGFALTVLAFYFSNVMDKLGRANTMMMGGVLFLVGGWFLERARRRLIARLEASK